MNRRLCCIIASGSIAVASVLNAGFVDSHNNDHSSSSYELSTDGPFGSMSWETFRTTVLMGPQDCSATTGRMEYNRHTFDHHSTSEWNQHTLTVCWNEHAGGVPTDIKLLPHYHSSLVVFRRGDGEFRCSSARCAVNVVDFKQLFVKRWERDEHVIEWRDHHLLFLRFCL